jgi:3-hydroxyisobutyrate dehydrogenase-like beta-hydroxyacid dehydrogenase
MRIGILGAGRIGGNAARLWSRAGHDVLISFSRHPDELPARAAELGDHVGATTPAQAVDVADVVMLAVPWDAIDEALRQSAGLAGAGPDRRPIQRRPDAGGSLRQGLQHADRGLPSVGFDPTQP